MSGLERDKSVQNASSSSGLVIFMFYKDETISYLI
jgi:hypothetical protein